MQSLGPCPQPTPRTWSTCSPAARRLSRKVSLQALCEPVLSRLALSCCRPRSSSQTRTKSAGNQQGQRQGRWANSGMPAQGGGASIPAGHPGSRWRVGAKRLHTWPTPLYSKDVVMGKGTNLLSFENQKERVGKKHSLKKNGQELPNLMKGINPKIQKAQ